MKINKNSGLSLVEVLIVVAILTILMIMALTMLPKQMQKARDATRKSDLQKIKRAFEHYYNDNGCYPASDVLENCGGKSPVKHSLSPYLQDIPCDPSDGSYYLYAPYDKQGGSNTCDGYRVWTKLEEDDDPEISNLNCDGSYGCGAFEYFEDTLGETAYEYDYGVSEGVPVATSNNDYIYDTGYCCAGVCNAWTRGSGSCNDGPYRTYDDCVNDSICTE